MRSINGPVKQSGDIHPPELDDGFDDIDEPVAATVTATPRHAGVARSPPSPSLMPLLGLAAAALLLIRLIRR